MNTANESEFLHKKVFRGVTAILHKPFFEIMLWLWLEIFKFGMYFLNPSTYQTVFRKQNGFVVLISPYYPNNCSKHLRTSAFTFHIRAANTSVYKNHLYSMVNPFMIGFA